MLESQFYSDASKGYTSIKKPYVDKLTSRQKELHSGVDLFCPVAHSISYGVIIGIQRYRENKSNILYSVTVQVTESDCIRYCSLTDVKVKFGDTIKRLDEIGSCYQNTLHIEYLTTGHDDAIWTYSIGSLTFYKHDPTPLLDGTIKFADSTNTQSAAIDYTINIEFATNKDFAPMKFTEDMSAEFTNNRGGG